MLQTAHMKISLFLLSFWILYGLLILLLFKGRGWYTRLRFGKPVRMNPEHVDAPFRKVKDLAIGEEAYVSGSAISVSKKGLTYIDRESFLEKQSGLWVLHVVRLKKGFALTVLPETTFRISSLAAWNGIPVIELRQAIESETESVEH
jgi:hypothetical protein